MADPLWRSPTVGNLQPRPGNHGLQNHGMVRRGRKTNTNLFRTNSSSNPTRGPGYPEDSARESRPKLDRESANRALSGSSGLGLASSNRITFSCIAPLSRYTPQKRMQLFLLTVGSFLLTVELFYLRLTVLALLLAIGAFLLTFLAFLLTVGAFLLTVGAFLLTVGKCL